MTTSFPTDKAQLFVADNGVTYYWDSDRWRVKQYKLDDAALEDYATEQWTEEKIAEAMLDGTVDLTSYATVVYSDAEDANLQNQIDELGVTKGKVARYTTENTSGTPVARPGQLSVNATSPSSVTLISFGTEDADGILTKPMANGDIIEFVDAVSGDVSRFRITDATAAPTVVAVEYSSGENDFEIGHEEQVYIYPQNSSSGGGGTPVGSIMMWVNSTPPVGWFKLKGESFDIETYPALHAYLQKSEGYTSGKLPDWRGHYPGQLGDHLNGDVGIKLGQKTAMPSGGAPKTSTKRPTGHTRTFNGAGGTTAYSDGLAEVEIDSGWDDVTRPKTVAVHFIIKHD